MNLQPHAHSDEMRVWLSLDEVEQLIGQSKNTEQRIAIQLGAYCGLRSHEILDVTPSDVVDTDAGIMLRVEHGKGDKYRETPVPSNVATTIRTVAEVRPEADTESIVSVSSTRSLRRWVKQAAERCEAITGDDKWNHLSTHDLRRTWAGQMRRTDVDPLVVLKWGGWNDLETFLNHYRGEDTPEEQKAQREKVEWLD